MKHHILVFIALLFLIESTLAAHYIVGYVEDALTGEEANGKTITLWNPQNGQSDNLTDIIGPTGNSGANNIYLIDCELLDTSCTVGDVLSLKIFNNGDNNVSEIQNITVTGSGFDNVNNITLNSPPQTNLITPINAQNVSQEITFNCSIFDYDDNIANVSLWSNFTGSWTINQTLAASPGETYKLFQKNLTEGYYQWTCSVQDNLSIQTFATQNRTLQVDTTPPVISSIELNETLLCSTYQVRVNCTTTDALLDIDTVIIQSISPSMVRTNYTASILTGDTYFRDITIATPGDWQFNCIANDTVGNEANLTSTSLQVDSNNAELVVPNENLFFNTTPQLENQEILVTANVSNIGCLEATNLVVGFYNGNKSSGGTSLTNITNTIPGRDSLNFSINFTKNIGLENLFVYADINNSFSETNETNNEANKTIYLQAWQKMYGNTSIDKILSNAANSNITFWLNHSNIEGNIFVADSESNINWYSLQALGRDTNNNPVTNDFTELDSSLAMTNYNDSVYNTFTTSGIPKEEQNYTVFQKIIQNVPSINSTDNNDNFITGILWDTSDSSDNEYNQTEKEDIVFIAKVNRVSLGAYGTYDYEARIPSKLREYDATDTQEVFFYYEIN